MKKCLVVGAAMLDIVMQIEELPQRGADVYADSQTMSVGGCAYNVADILKHFEVPYTLFAPVGTGMYADMVGRKLKQAGHESPIRSDKSDNGYCLCLVEKDGERTFITLPGIECTFEKEWFDRLDVEEYNSVYVCGYEVEGEGGNQIIQFLEEHPELTVYYAPGPRIQYIDAEKHDRIYALHPILHLNEKEAKEYTGCNEVEQAASALYAKTENAVLITLGEKGVYLYDNGTGKILPSSKADVVDTIGAGDSHIGAVIAMQQLGNDLETSLKTANQVSALVVGVQGPSITKEEFQRVKF